MWGEGARISEIFLLWIDILNIFFFGRGDGD